MSDQVSASHILLMYAGSQRSSVTRSKEEAMLEAMRLQKAIQGGADFGELAKQHSDCPSGQQGGDLGKFGRGQMVRSFEEATCALDIGATSDIVETPFGFHLILRTG